MEQPERYILIDDDSINNMFSKIIIKEASGGRSDIQMFTNPEKAVAYIESEYLQHPVLTYIFLDINMPSLNGWEVLEKLKYCWDAIKKFIKIYILSSSVDPNDKQRADLNPQVSGFIEKPLSVQTVNKLCDK